MLSLFCCSSSDIYIVGFLYPEDFEKLMHYDFLHEDRTKGKKEVKIIFCPNPQEKII